MASPIPASAVSENLRKHIDPKAPVPLRIMAAKGMVPMGPKDMVTVLTSLSFDDDDKVESAAIDSLLELPDRILDGALQEKLHPLVLDHLARTLGEEKHLERILLNTETPDETFAYLADQVEGRLLGIVLENQVRLLRHKSIVSKVLENPSISKAQVDRLMDFAVRTDMEFEGLEVFEAAKIRVRGAPKDPDVEKEIRQVVEASLPEDLLKPEVDDLDTLDKEEAEIKKKTLLQRLSDMTIAQKVALAQKGNKTVRSALVKERNKLVCTAAIKNPGVNEAEAAAIAMNRSVSDDVIRIICNNREWTRSYQVKVALVNNPKTPMATAMRFLGIMRNPDLKNISRSKSIPSALAKAAKAMLRKRQGG